MDRARPRKGKKRSSLLMLEIRFFSEDCISICQTELVNGLELLCELYAKVLFQSPFRSRILQTNSVITSFCAEAIANDVLCGYYQASLASTKPTRLPLFSKHILTRTCSFTLAFILLRLPLSFSAICCRQTMENLPCWLQAECSSVI